MSIRRPILHDIINLNLDPTIAHSNVGKDGHIRVKAVEVVKQEQEEHVKLVQESESIEEKNDEAPEEQAIESEQTLESKTERQLLIEKYPELANLRGAPFARRLKKLQQASEAS